MTTAIPRCHFLTREWRNKRFLNSRALYIGFAALSLAGCTSISQTDFCDSSSVKANSKTEKCETSHALRYAATSSQSKRDTKNIFDKVLNQKEENGKNSEKNLEIKTLVKEIARIHSGHIGIKASGLDKSSFEKLFTSLIKQESNFNTKAVSPVGAKGLGQLMPATARELGVRNPFQARANLDGSARYLTRMLAKFKSVDKALAAYNAGPGRVRQYGGVPPFKETQNYIKKIREYSQINWEIR